MVLGASCFLAETQRSYDRPMPPSYISYGLLYVLADQNDTYERIAADMGISAKKLAKYNDTPEDYLSMRETSST